MQTDTFTALPLRHNPAAVARGCSALRGPARIERAGADKQWNFSPYRDRKGMQMLVMPAGACGRGIRRHRARESVQPAGKHVAGRGGMFHGKERTLAASGWTGRLSSQKGVCQRVALGRTVMVTTPVTPELSFLIRVVPTLRARNFGV